MGERELFKKVLIKDDHHVLYSNSEETIVYQEYYQNIPLNEQQIKQIHDILSGRKYIAYLIRVNGGSLISFEDETWVEKLGLSLLYDAGILFVAYISPNNIFSNLEIEKVIKTNTNNKLRIRVFKETGEAIAWLQSFQIL